MTFHLTNEIALNIDTTLRPTHLSSLITLRDGVTPLYSYLASSQVVTTAR